MQKDFQRPTKIHSFMEFELCGNQITIPLYKILRKMLQQILNDMYIDPELLAELDEEQRHILFCKMREEQVRRWKIREVQLEKEDAIRPQKKTKPGVKKVDFLLGKDGCPWVWVMGEHPNDRSIEQILEEEAQEKARMLAEKEAEEFRKKQEIEIQQKLQEEKKRLEQEELQRQFDLKTQEEEKTYALLKEQQRLEKEKRIKDEEDNKKLQSLKIETVSQKRALFEKLCETPPKISNQVAIDSVPVVLRKSTLFREEKEAKERKHQEEMLQKLREKRTSELYMSFKEARENAMKLAEESRKQQEEIWKEQEKRAREAEEQIRAIARRAREEHKRNSLQVTTSAINALTANLAKRASVNDNVSQVSRPAKPVTKEDVKEWFRKEEARKGSHVDPTTNKVATWFHGVISRAEAERLLMMRPIGSFLVRVSERIWGYAISYRAADRCKHFLIDASEGTYHFLGSNQVHHSKLIDLINYHRSKPISTSGQEYLIDSCVQDCDPPDYQELVEEVTML